MMKYRVVVLCVTAALASLAAAQSSKKVELSSSKSGTDPLKSAIQPLTPKSATASPRRASVAVPQASASSRATDVELGRLERQSPKSGVSKSGGTGTFQASAAKHTAASPASGSGINATYHPPHVPYK